MEKMHKARKKVVGESYDTKKRDTLKEVDFEQRKKDGKMRVEIEVETWKEEVKVFPLEILRISVAQHDREVAGSKENTVNRCEFVVGTVKELLREKDEKVKRKKRLLVDVVALL